MPHLLSCFCGLKGSDPFPPSRGEAVVAVPILVVYLVVVHISLVCSYLCVKVVYAYCLHGLMSLKNSKWPKEGRPMVMLLELLASYRVF